MCGIFGIIGDFSEDQYLLNILARKSEQRGKDSSGLMYYSKEKYSAIRSSKSICQTIKNAVIDGSHFVMGHSRLVTNGMLDNQPVIRNGVCLIHNGIIVNHREVWKMIGKNPNQEIDSEVIAAITECVVDRDKSVENVSTDVSKSCDGIIACAICIPAIGKLCLFSNNGSLYTGRHGSKIVFSSERHPLEVAGCIDIQQIRLPGITLDIPKTREEVVLIDDSIYRPTLVPNLGQSVTEEKLLKYEDHPHRRCVKCILPATMPFISFDPNGVCNYCKSYKPRNKPKPIEHLLELIKPYRRLSGNDCIVPFSGGRDSCYTLHLAVKALGLKPITYTYDWGMVTDLGRRNISRMCARLGVENIIVAADISKKRRNIAMNLEAWLAAPHLGMVSILTAGDKHFFKHVETVKNQTRINLNLWGVNPLEVTHFKAGFLGVPPDFQEKRVYSSGALKQCRYQLLRLKAMLSSLGYFNSSLFDTLTGEYYRSFKNKSDYHHIFDFCRWDEKIIDEVIKNEYDWETAPDTSSTWRIGDGTAAIYNYIYYSVAGFTEHDTFRSNQIREGDITRDEALDLVKDENRPRYPNLKWYLDAIGLDFKLVVNKINSIPKIRV